MPAIRYGVPSALDMRWPETKGEASQGRQIVSRVIGHPLLITSLSTLGVDAGDTTSWRCEREIDHPAGHIVQPPALGVRAVLARRAGHGVPRVACGLMGLGARTR
jgi:hypothetical protein